MMVFFVFLVAITDVSIVHLKKKPTKTEPECWKDSDHSAIEAFFTIITTNEIHH